MIGTMKQSGETKNYLNQYFADKREDIVNLPLYPKAAYGSTCIVWGDCSLWYLSEETKNWKEVEIE